MDDRSGWGILKIHNHCILKTGGKDRQLVKKAEYYVFFETRLWFFCNISVEGVGSSGFSVKGPKKETIKYIAILIS